MRLWRWQRRRRQQTTWSRDRPIWSDGLEKLCRSSTGFASAARSQTDQYRSPKRRCLARIRWSRESGGCGRRSCAKEALPAARRVADAGLLTLRAAPLQFSSAGALISSLGPGTGYAGQQHKSCKLQVATPTQIACLRTESYLSAFRSTHRR